MDFDQFKKTYCHNAEPEDKHGGSLYRGFTFNDVWGVARNIPDEFDLNDEWSDGYYRNVWTSFKNLAIITYCEGDVDVEIYETPTAFNMAIKACDAFYSQLA